VADFRNFFDPKRLDEQTLGCVEYVLASPAYADVFEPYLRGIRDTLSQRLLDPSKDRKEEHPDDFLRGGIVCIDGLLSFFRQIVTETQFERINTSLQGLSPEERYRKAANDGLHDPVLGASEPYEVGQKYDPAEDY
jgi:hypothetical protein